MDMREDSSSRRRAQLRRWSRHSSPCGKVFLCISAIRKVRMSRHGLKLHFRQLAKEGSTSIVNPQVRFSRMIADDTIKRGVA
jgi:hypothetical protein